MAGFERGRNLEKVGHASAGHRRAVLRQRRGAQGEPARRGGQRLRLADDQPPAGAAVDRDDGAPPRASTCSSCAWTTPRSARRSAGRSGSSSTTASCSPRWPPRRTSPGSSSTTACSGTTTASSTPSSRRWRSGGPPSCRRRSSTRACSSRRLRLHARVPDRQGVHGQPDPDDLRRHDRDPEGDHRPLAGHLRTRRAKPGQVPGPADSRRPEWLHRQA